MTPRVAVPVLLVAVLVTCRCLVLPPVGIGDACRASDTCSSGLVCVLMDEDDPESDMVCMPPLSFDRTTCNEDVDCWTEGMPVDATCTAGRHCACDALTDGAQLSCTTGYAPGRFACACVSLDQTPAGQDCEHPEECASLICKAADGTCVEACESDDDCGGLTPRCDGGQCVEA